MNFIDDRALSNKPKIIIVDIGKRDKRIELMKNLLKQRKEQMFQHYQMCKGCVQKNVSTPSFHINNSNVDESKCENSNNDLIEIVNKYKKYYNEQLEKKQHQLGNMKNINNHLDNLLSRKELTHEHIDKIKNEQKEILEQLNSLDTEINDLTGKID